MRDINIKTPLLIAGRVVLALLVFLVVRFVYARYCEPLRYTRGLEELRYRTNDGEEQTLNVKEYRIAVTYGFDLRKTVYHGIAVYSDGSEREIEYNPFSQIFRFSGANGEVPSKAGYVLKSGR